MTETMTGTFLFVPKVPKFPSYTGHFTQWDGFNSNAHNAAGSFTINLRGVGSDGSILRFHENAHFSISASGVILAFDKPCCG